jgi:hypothetical protein
MRSLIYGLATFLLPATALPQAAVWTPKVEFTLETATYSETLAWISGWAYALTELGHSDSKEICLPKKEHVRSSVLLSALNEKFKDQRITAEQAAPILLAAAKARHGCKKVRALRGGGN